MGHQRLSQCLDLEREEERVRIVRVVLWLRLLRLCQLVKEGGRRFQRQEPGVVVALQLRELRGRVLLLGRERRVRGRRLLLELVGMDRPGRELRLVFLGRY